MRKILVTTLASILLASVIVPIAHAGQFGGKNKPRSVFISVSLLTSTSE